LNGDREKTGFSGKEAASCNINVSRMIAFEYSAIDLLWHPKSSFA
jgi:hypothetical protein